MLKTSSKYMPLMLLSCYTNVVIIGYCISRRRMTRAAKELTKAGSSATDIAMKYQYNSVEVFSRAFKRVWNVNPSDLHKTITESKN